MSNKNSEAFGFDLDAFDTVSACDAGFDLVMNDASGSPISHIDEDGNELALKFTILGKHAARVQKWVSKTVNQFQMEQMAAKKSGKEPELKSLDELRAQNIEGAVVRVIGWKNVSQQFSPDALRQALRKNPHWVEQIVNESDNLANFTKPSLAG